jgi:hypothetical protein
MERREILPCVVIRSDESGLWVRSGEAMGVVDQGSIAWKTEDFPATGDRVNVFVRFLTPEPEVPFDFVGSIKDAYPEKHPIHFLDDSIIGSRFCSRIRPLGSWWVMRHPTGVPALLPREAWDRPSVGDDAPVEVEVSAIDRERQRLLVRLPGHAG